VTTADAGRRARDAGWDISFLRVGALATAAAAVVAVPIAGLLAGWPSALGVLVGAVVVTAFFCVSGIVIAWAGRIDDALTLPAALGTFLVKAVLFFAALSAIPPDGWVDRLALAWSVVVGALLWSVVQARWVWTRQLYYVQPPAPPTAAPQASAQVRPDPERPTTRG
jgi:ATP synthase protein I